MTDPETTDRATGVLDGGAGVGFGIGTGVDGAVGLGASVGAVLQATSRMAASTTVPAKATR